MKLSKKKMIPIGLLTGLTVTSAIVTPLCCSCSVGPQATADHPIDPDGTDKKYNITDATYKALETQYTEKFEERLASRNLSLSSRRQEREEFNESLKALSNQTNSSNVSFSTRCDTIIDHAKQNYNIQLSRQNILDFKHIEQDFAATQETFVNGLRNYMNYLKLDSSKIEDHIASFRTKFNALQAQMTDPTDINGFADPLRALKETRLQAFSCMNSITAELDYVSASNKLIELFKNVRFAIKEKNVPTWDELMGKTGDWHKQHPEFSVGKDVTKCLDLVFDCFVKDKDGKENKVDLTTDEWTTTLVPGYKIGVIFVTGNEFKQGNVHNIDMDFTLVRQDALTKDAEYIRNATAHNASLKNTDDVKDIKSYNDLLKTDESKKHYLSFGLPVTDDYAKTLLEHEYADKLDFYWCKKEDGAYENFFTRTSGQGSEVSLTISQLAAAGLMVSPKYHHEQGQRLDYLMTHHDSKSDDILQKFIDSCSISSSTVVKKEDGHIVNNKISIFFSNQDTAKYQLQGDYNCSGFPISKKFYENSYNVFIKYYEHLALYDVNFKNKHIPENAIKSLLNGRIAEIVSYSVTVGITVGLTAYISFKMCLNPFSIPRKIIAISLLGISAGLCIADAAVIGKLSFEPVRNFYNAIKEVPTKCLAYKKLWDVAKDDYDNVYCDYDTFKNIPFTKARDRMLYYLTMANNPDNEKFETYLKNNHLTPDDFEALKEVNFITIIVSVFCTIASIAVSCVALRVTNPDEPAASTTVETRNASQAIKTEDLAAAEKYAIERTRMAEALGYKGARLTGLRKGFVRSYLIQIGYTNPKV